MAWLKLEPWSFDFQDRALFTKKKEKEKRFQMLWTNKLALIVLRIAVQGRGRVMDWEPGWHVCTAVSKTGNWWEPLRSTGSSAQRRVVASMGRKSKKEGMYVYHWFALLYSRN